MHAIATSVEVARRARDAYAAEADVDPAGLLVAGSVGPYGAMLADGAEYRGDYDPGRDVLRDLHAPRMEALLEAGADLLAIETIPTLREAIVLVELVDELGATAWLSFQCRDGGTTAAGEPIGEAVAVGRETAGLVAIGVNCTAPRHVPALLAAAGAATDLPRIAYPNSGDRWDPGDPPVAGRPGRWVRRGGRRVAGGGGGGMARRVLRDRPGRDRGTHGRAGQRDEQARIARDPARRDRVLAR